MSMPDEMSVLRRKLRAGQAAPPPRVPGLLEAVLPRVLARVAEAQMQLAVSVGEVTEDRLTPSALVAGLDPGALVALLDGDAGPGLIAVGRDALHALVEVQTTGRVGAGAVPDRPPTRTDMAVVTPFLGAVLANLTAVTGPLRITRMVDDTRPLPIFLGEAAQRAVQMAVTFGEGPARTGSLLIAWAEAATASAGPEFAGSSGLDAAAAAGEAGWQDRLERSVMAAPTELEAVLCRVTLPLEDILELKPGSEVVVPRAAINQVRVEGRTGGRVVTGRLGQSRGFRAVRVLQDRTEGGRRAADAGPPSADPPARRADDAVRSDGDWTAAALPADPAAAITAMPVGPT